MSPGLHTGIGTSGQNVAVGSQAGVGTAAKAVGTNRARPGAAMAKAKAAIPNAKADAIRRRFFMRILPAQRRTRRIMNLFL